MTKTPKRFSTSVASGRFESRGTAVFIIYDGTFTMAHFLRFLRRLIHRGKGEVTSSPFGIECSNGTCPTSYETGTVVTLTPKADPAWEFSD